MAGIYELTSGVLETAGHVMPLFNLMEGMMPDATGREFIRIRGVLLGLELKELDKLAEDVIEFCELGSYIDMPVRAGEARLRAIDQRLPRRPAVR